MGPAGICPVSYTHLDLYKRQVLIPTPFPLTGEGFSLLEHSIVDEHIGKLRWRCRRGMKELDLLTLGYLERHYP